MADEEEYDFCWHALVEPEHPLDKAMRTNDQALRCYYAEHGDALGYHSLGASKRAEYERLPIVEWSGLASGTFFIQLYSGKVQEIDEEAARQHPMFAFQAF
jgi:hypothetical protein